VCVDLDFLQRAAGAQKSERRRQTSGGAHFLSVFHSGHERMQFRQQFVKRLPVNAQTLAAVFLGQPLELPLQ